MDIVQFCLLLVLPWVVHLYIILRQRNHAHNSGRSLLFWNRAFAAWFSVLIAFAVPAAMWTSDNHNSIDTVRWLLTATFVKVSDALVHVLRYVLPFAAYPFVVFGFKLLLDNSVGANGEGDSFQDVRHRQQHRMQAQLITFAIKVVVVAFVFFDMITSLGIPSDKVLQMGTIFGVGLSWATSDWLRSLWASFMLAFTTDLTTGSEILLGSPSPTDLTESDQWLIVQEPGLIFTICTPCSRPCFADEKAGSSTLTTLQNPITGVSYDTRGTGFGLGFGPGPIAFAAIPSLESIPSKTASPRVHISTRRPDVSRNKRDFQRRLIHFYIPNSSLLGGGFVHRNIH